MPFDDMPQGKLIMTYELLLQKKKMFNMDIILRKSSKFKDIRTLKMSKKKGVGGRREIKEHNY